MNQDKEAFEKWFKDYWEVDFNAGNPRFMGQSISWKYACEYKQKEIDCLQAENKKLRDVLENIKTK